MYHKMLSPFVSAVLALGGLVSLARDFDDGRTWPESHHLLLDEGRGAGYPSLTRVDDRHVGIVYEGSQSHLAFKRFTLDELLKR